MKSLICAFCFLISAFNTNAQNVGIGTNTPFGKLQINHRGSVINPTLNLVDSSSNTGPIILFRNLGGAKTWEIRAYLNHLMANNDYLDFVNNGDILATIVSSGNFGIGNISPAEKLDVGGTIKLSGELNRTSTGNSNMVPIAYGNISSTGAINSGSGNFSVSKPLSGWYSITITGEPFFLTSYTSVATPIGNAAFVATSSGSGNLLVFTYNMSGVSTDNSFCFAVYKQ
jgi:hypothetical protein